MTTIVWDGKTLAADGRCTLGNVIVQDDVIKICMDGKSEVRGSTVICYAIAGDADMDSIVGDWIAEGCPVTDKFNNTDFDVIIITEDSAYTYSTGANDLYTTSVAEFLGSGYAFARSAVALKMNAVKAVKHAAQIDMCSGGEGTFINCRSKHPVLKKFNT